MKRKLAMQSGLYAIVDHDACQARGLDVAEVGRAMAAAQVPLLQLRAKRVPDELYLSWLEQLLATTTASDLIVNDRVDLALLANAPGVHVGQGDLPLSEVHKCGPALITGVSTHNLTQLHAEILNHPDYLAFGPVFSTGSKRDPEPVTGLEQLALAHQITQKAKLPLVAIGGIVEAALMDVTQHCEFVAAISLLLPAEKEAKPYSFIEKRCLLLDRSIKQYVEIRRAASVG